MTSVADKTVLITGGASGIGLMMAQRIAEQRGKVIIWDVDTEALTRVAKDFSGRGVDVVTYTCNLADKTDIQQTAERVLSAQGAVDILINNAGVVSGKLLLDISDEQIERTFAVNTLALFWTTRAFLPGMIERDAGHIVTIASAGGLAGTSRLTDYCSSKFAAVGFDDSLRAELNSLGSRIVTTVVCPYYINTGMFDGVKTRFPALLPILRPEKVVDQIIKTIRLDRRRMITPWFIYSTWLIRLLPVAASDWLLDFFGITKSMDDFTGRKKPS